MHRLLLPLLLVLASQASAFEEFWPVPAPSSSEARVLAATSNVERELAQIDVLVEAAAWDEAVDALLRLSDESSTELLAVDDNHYLPVSSAAGMRIARWPAEGIAVYRERVDAAARSLFERGIRERDRESLLAVLDDYFASSFGDDALLALADMALEAGRTAEARGYLLQLSPAVLGYDGRPLAGALAKLKLDPVLSNEDKLRLRDKVKEKLESRRYPTTATLVYPDTDIPTAEILARLAMVSIREQSLDRAEQELALLELAFPDAVATIGGREAKLVDAVSATLTSAREWPTPAPLTDWTTYGGDATRAGVAGPIGDVSQPQWRRQLVQAPLQIAPQGQLFLNFNGQLVQPTPTRQTPDLVYPLVSGEALAIEQQSKWLALDRTTGKPMYGEHNAPVANRQLGDRVARVQNRGNPIQRPMGGAQQQIRIQVGGNARVVIEGRAIQGGAAIRGMAINGPVIIGNRFQGGFPAGQTSPVPPAAMAGAILYHTQPGNGTGQNRLEATDLSAEGKLRLEIEPGAGKMISGPPVVADGHLYVPIRETAAGGRVEIACYARSTGRLLWQTAVASLTDLTTSPGDTLVAGEGMLFLSTDGGVVVAVRASDGRTMWAHTYERANSTKPNDLSQVASRQFGAAALVAGALVCAPADSPAMFALDPISGRMLWTNDQAWDVDHLLGVAGGRLIASGRQLWFIDPTSGKTQFTWPDSMAAELTGSGRGCIAGEEVFWPTERAIYVFDCRAGQQSRNPISLKDLDGVGGANLVPCGEGLLVATQKELILLGNKPAEPEEEQPQPKPATLSQR